MSEPAALAAVLAALTACGLGVLALLGAARSVSDLLRLAPLAPLAGMAWIGVAAATSATSGQGFGVGALVVTSAATCAAGAFRLLLRPGQGVLLERQRRGRRSDLLAIVPALVVLALVVGYALATYRVKPLEEYDGWAMWGMKAKAIAWLDADPAVLASSTYERLHLEYPLLLPALHAVPIDAAASYSSNIVVLSCLAIGLAGLLAIWGLLRDRVRSTLLIPFVAAVAAMPAFFYQLGSGYADAPLAMFVAAGVAAGARWLLDPSAPWLALATLFLAAAALAKNEGLLFALAVLVSLFAAATGRRRAVLVSAAVVAVVYAPWRAYVAVHDLGAPEYDLSSSFDVPWVARRLERVPEAVWAIVEQAFRPGEVGVLVALALISATFAIGLGRRRVGLFGLGFVVVSLAGLTWIYVISPLEVSSFASSSAHRVVLSVVVGSAALAPLLLEECARSLAARARPSADDGSLTGGGSQSSVLRRRPTP